MLSGGQHRTIDFVVRLYRRRVYRDVEVALLNQLVYIVIGVRDSEPTGGGLGTTEVDVYRRDRLGVGFT